MCDNKARLAQLVEHGSYEPKVAGSNPALSKVGCKKLSSSPVGGVGLTRST